MSSIRLDMTFPVSELRKDLKSHIDRIAETDCAEVVTVQGKPKVVMVSAKTYQAMVDEILFLQHLPGIERGAQQAREGKTSPMRDSIAQIAKDFDIQLDDAS